MSRDDQDCRCACGTVRSAWVRFKRRNPSLRRIVRSLMKKDYFKQKILPAFEAIFRFIAVGALVAMVIYLLFYADDISDAVRCLSAVASISSIPLAMKIHFRFNRLNLNAQPITVVGSGNRIVVTQLANQGCEYRIVGKKPTPEDDLERQPLIIKK